MPSIEFLTASVVAPQPPSSSTVVADIPPAGPSSARMVAAGKANCVSAAVRAPHPHSPAAVLPSIGWLHSPVTRWFEAYCVMPALQSPLFRAGSLYSGSLCDAEGQRNICALLT